MEKRRIGSLEVPVAGLGCNNFGWRIDANATAAVLDAALDSGVNFLDTADMYGAGESEEFIGRALGGRRKRVILATKFGLRIDEARPGGARPEYVRSALNESLLRLRTDYVDLYQLHRPDPEVPIAETLGALDDLVKAGKIREIGCSNFSAVQLREAAAAVRPGGARFVSVQNEYSLLHREPESEVLPECNKQVLAFLPYFPLASGLLTGKYRRGQTPPEGSRGHVGFGPKVYTDRNLAIVEALIEFVSQRGHTLLELAFSWLAAQPGIASVIAGATSPEQVRANAAAMTWRPTAAELAEIDRIVSRPMTGAA